MTTTDLNPLRLNVATLATQGASLSGTWPLATLDRLAALVPAERPVGPGDEVNWSVRGERRLRVGFEPEIWVHLRASVRLALVCQRCLTPVEAQLDLDRALRFVAGEAQAAALDADSEDDVLALTKVLDLRELVEDELLLALPLVPRHARCPEPLLAGAGADPGIAFEDDRPNPFAVLRKLKEPGSAGH